VARRLLRAVRLILVLQARAYFPHAYIGLAAGTVLAFRLAIPEHHWPFLLPAFLLGEQGVLALTLVGAHVYLERNEGSAVALAVTPLRSAEYVAALLVGCSMWATVAGVLLFAGVFGLDSRTALLVPPLFAMSVFAGMIGLGFATQFSEFLHFLLGSIPGTVFLALAYLPYLGAAHRWSTAWLPSDWALGAFATLASGELDPVGYGARVALLALACAALFPWVSRRYRERVRYRLELVHE
jgi:hypothetical protein